MLLLQSFEVVDARGKRFPCSFEGYIENPRKNGTRDANDRSFPDRVGGRLLYGSLFTAQDNKKRGSTQPTVSEPEGEMRRCLTARPEIEMGGNFRRREMQRQGELMARGD